MDTLLTEAEPGDATAVARQLSSAGHRVATCQTPGRDQCVAVETEQGCPLALRNIGVVVDVRRRPIPCTSRELGAVCALRAAVPLVICGPTPPTPGPWRDADILTDDEHLAYAVAEAHSAIGPTARRRVEQAVRAVLRPYRLAPPDSVVLRDRHGAVDVLLKFHQRVSPLVREELRTVGRAALAPLTAAWPYATVITTDATTDRPVGEPAVASSASAKP